MDLVGLSVMLRPTISMGMPLSKTSFVAAGSWPAFAST